MPLSDNPSPTAGEFAAIIARLDELKTANEQLTRRLAELETRTSTAAAEQPA
ncbi:MAG: hypothetical protein ABI140_03340 [Jatrophihabitantaceae bacterium]